MQPAARRVFLAGIALAVTGSVLFSGKAVVVKLAYRYGVDPATLLALRMAFALPFFVVAYVWSARGAAPLATADHLRLIVIGLLGYYAASYFDFLGLQHITAGLERLILYLSPTLVLLMSALFLGKRFDRRDVLALVLAYSGIVLAFWHDVRFEGGGRVVLGSALVFASAVCYAVYLVLSGELVRRVGAIRLTSYAMTVSTIAVFIQFLWLNPIGSLVQPAPVYWLSILNAVLCTVLPVFATMLAIERIGAARTSMASMVGPIATISLAYIVLDETVSVWQAAGTVLVLAGVYILSTRGQPRPDPNNDPPKEIS